MVSGENINSDRFKCTSFNEITGNTGRVLTQINDIFSVLIAADIASL